MELAHVTVCRDHLQAEEVATKCLLYWLSVEEYHKNVVYVISPLLLRGQALMISVKYEGYSESNLG
jgi:hypothetical protein